MFLHRYWTLSLEAYSLEADKISLKKIVCTLNKTKYDAWRLSFGSTNSEVFFKIDATKKHSKCLKDTSERIQFLVKLQALGVQLY